MDISVLIASYNGEKTLPITLQSFVDADTKGLDWELLICLNNSTDNSEQVIDEYADKLPIKIFHEKLQGTSPSFNRLMDNCQGDLIAFTADDVIVSPNWLKKGISLTKEKPEYQVFGGRIKAYYGEHEQPWLKDFEYDHVAYANTPAKFTYGEVGPGTIFGACLIVRREIIDTGIRYDVNIGPNGKNYIMGNETDYLTRVAAQGYKFWFNQDFTLQHIIAKFQMEFSWLEKRAFRYGLSMYPKDLAKNFEGTKAVWGIPLWRINLFFQCWLKARLGSKQHPEYANYAWEVGYFKGYIKRRIGL
ncbi:glycosyltransferase [Candidatus Colwellia aromaticivorans]|uniref:glycosyltransferase n=1 Tax=Candidatus Colwellia aromaticivorans TaxID=2267621 RepID=UPI000DF4AB2A|nr:glycosyltransferase [Candidatus Colwellia aromaticivorans]